MAKRSKPLKLPDDFLGSVRALLQTPPQKRQRPKRKGKKQARKAEGA
jgi:hypothetical protein